MTEPAVSCCNAQAVYAGLISTDFSALDVLAVKLHCLDTRFAAPLRQIATVLGERIANEKIRRQLPSEEALSQMLSVCGFPTSLESRFLECHPDGARLQVTGCGEVCCPIPRVERSVCGFNAGVFEGFLRAVTGQTWTVEETTCLGLGDPSCEFLFRVATPHAGGEHGRH